MSEPRRIMPLPLGGEHGLPYSRGLMARALMAVGVAPDRAYSLARKVGDDLERARQRRRRARPARGARDRDARRGRGPRGAAAAPPLPGAARARPADRHPRRRRDRHRQVDGRDGDRVPARDHARHVDRLRPADDARVLLARVHAVDPLLELRGRRSPCPRPTTRSSRASSSSRGRCSSACARRSSARCRKAGRWCSKASTSCRACCRRSSRTSLVSACVLQISDETAHAQHFFSRESGANRPMAKYLDRFEEIRRLQDYIVGRAERAGVPVIENENANRATRGGRRARAVGGGARAGARVTATESETGVEQTPDSQAPCQCQSYLRATEHAALRAARWLGRADQEAAEEAAADGMRMTLDGLPIQRARRLRLGRRRRAGSCPARCSARAARRSTSRSTRSRAAASSRAAATARCR